MGWVARTRAGSAEQGRTFGAGSRPCGRRSAAVLARGHQQVDALEGGQPMRKDHDDAATLADGADCFVEAGQPRSVETCVRLIEYDEERIAVKRTGEGDALTLCRWKAERRPCRWVCGSRPADAGSDRECLRPWMRGWSSRLSGSRLRLRSGEMFSPMVPGKRLAS